MSYDLATVQRAAMERHINQVATDAARYQERLQTSGDPTTGDPVSIVDIRWRVDERIGDDLPGFEIVNILHLPDPTPAIVNPDEIPVTNHGGGKGLQQEWWVK